MTADTNELRRRMDGALKSLHQEFGGLRTGRANASLLEHIQVDAYGSMVPLNQVANISIPEPRLLSVQVWDKGTVKSVEKAIIGMLRARATCAAGGTEIANNGPRMISAPSSTAC